MAQVVAMAIGAHPDDIEFMMAGTLLKLKQARAEIHVWNLANGNCGSATLPPAEIARVRLAEAQASARLAGAIYHRPIVDDLAIFYEPGLVARVTAVIREVKPTILLVPSPQDYMEDHANTCRLAVTAAFARGVANYASKPPVPPYGDNIALYHAEPYGLHDSLRQLIRPTHYVDVGGVYADKEAMLSSHASQKEWLDVSQGIGSYVEEMNAMCGQVGLMSGRFALAEGWRLHLHLGFAPRDFDPLPELLGDACWIEP